MGRISNIFAVVFLTTALLLSCQGVFAMTQQTEAAIGRGVNEKLVKKYGIYDNSKVQKYVEHVGLKIVSVSDRQNIVYHFTVLDAKEIDSFSAPGGYVYITKGFLTKLKTEAQLAAVLAAEVVHIAYRHSIPSIEKNMAFHSVSTANKKDVLMHGIMFAYDLIDVGVHKKIQSEADIKAAEYLLRSGYDPMAMIRMLDVIQVQEKRDLSSVQSYIMSHHKTTRRIDVVRLMISNLKAAHSDKFEAALGKSYPDKYIENVLDVM